MSEVSTARYEPARGLEPRTRAGEAFERLRLDIIRGRLDPDARLRLEDLRERYEIGFSPLREALMRLRSEGLVVLEQQKGFRVSPVSLDHLNDLTRIRKEMECLGLEWSIVGGDVEWEANVIAAFHRLSRQSKAGPDDPMAINEQWIREHRAFHSALVSASGSKLLGSMCDTLFDQAERYVAVSIRYMSKARDDVGEHEALMRAVLDRDAAVACRLCREHIQRTTDKVIASSGLFEVEATRGASP